jgi:hypothetical protein
MTTQRIETMQDLEKAAPSFFLSSECRTLEPLLRKIDRRSRGEVWQTFKRKFRSDAAEAAIPEFIHESGRRALRLLAAARCTALVPWKQPSIGNVAELASLNRNVVAEFARALTLVGLLEMREEGRRKFVRPTEVGDLFTDLALSKTSLLRSYFDKVLTELGKGSIGSETVELMETVELTFDLAKMMYPKNTLNYEIYDTLHDMIIQLIAALRSGRTGEAKRLARELAASMRVLEESGGSAEALRLKPILLEDTGERVGRGRIFRPIRSR